MPTLIAYEHPLISGKGYGLNTTGVDKPNAFGIFDLVDFDTGVITDNGSVYKSIVNKDGVTYSLAVAYSYLDSKINTITLGISGQTVLLMTNLNLTTTDLLLYEGLVALQKLLQGNDSIVGNSGADYIAGWSGTDSIYGQAGDDYLDGGDGNDFLSGGAGNDTLMGGVGYDSYSGGAGVDTVVFNFDRNDYGISRNPVSGVAEIIFKSAAGTELIPVDIELIQFRDSVIPNNSQITYIGTFNEEKAGGIASVYRFYNTRDKAFFYTNSPDERSLVISKSSPTNENIDEWPYVYQGVTFESAHTYSGAVALFRFYNTQTGHHFFTASRDEAVYVKSMSLQGLWPFKDEGVAFNVYATDPTKTTVGQEIAVHRFYSQSLNRHFFTGDQKEVDLIKLTGIWTYEGIAFFGELPGG